MVAKDAGKVVVARTGRRVNLVKVARAQRVLNVLVLIAVVLYAGVIGSSVLGLTAQVGGAPILVGMVLYAVVGLLAVIQSVRVAVASGANVVIAVLAGFLMFIPLIGLLLLLRANAMASRVLKDNGIPLGLFGVRAADMSRLVEGSCTGCGYDIRGLAGPSCPECGAALRAA